MANTHSEKVADAAHETISKVADKAASVEEQVREKASETREKAHEQTAEISEAVCQYVNDKPLAALGIAFVAGIVASSLLRR